VSATNTPGDADSLFKISQPGSYYLTGDITGVSGKTGIEVAADSVTLDLNGFQVVGVAGALVGVGDAANTTRTGVTVRNGVVRDWPSGGVRFFKFGSSRLLRFQDVTSRNNGSHGFECRDSSIFIHCESGSNVGAGFFVGDGCLFESCVAHQNGAAGFDVSFGAQVTGCLARSNTGAGFLANDATLVGCTATFNSDGFSATRCTLTGCQASFNSAWGINASSGSLVNSCGASNNTTGGILANTGTVVRGCQVSASGVGIRTTGSDACIDGNSVSGGTTCFDITGSGNIVMRNTASGGTVRYSFTGVHTTGPIVSVAGTITSTVSTANFEY